MLKKWTMCALAVVVVYAVGCGGEPVEMSAPSGANGEEVSQTTGPAPDEVFAEFTQAVKEKDGEKMWDMLSKKDRSFIAENFDDILSSEDYTEKFAQRLKISANELRNLSTKEIFLQIEKVDPMKEIDYIEITDTAVNDSQATITLILEDDKTEQIYFDKEDGAWKVSLFSTTANREAITSCKKNLNQLSLAMVLYELDKGAFNPTTLEDLLPYLDDYGQLRCSKDTRIVPYQKYAGNLAEFASYYIRMGCDESAITDRTKYVIAYDKAYYHMKNAKPAVNVLFKDKHMETLNPGEFEALMTKQETFGPKTRFFGWEGDTPPMPAMP